jgi:hypothetical protein
MEPNEQELRERYALQETQELLDLHRRGDLTLLASSVLKQVLESRGVDPGRAAAAEQQDIPTPPPPPEQPVMSEAEMKFALNKLRENQNLIAGILVGAAAALVGAVIWAVITALTQYQIGWMAIGVGFLVAAGVRVAGKGIDKIFGIVSALLSLIGCVVGNLLTAIYVIAKTQGVPVLDALAALDLRLVVEIMVAMFNPMDILFYVLAMYVGYRYARRPVTPADLSRSRGRIA